MAVEIITDIPVRGVRETTPPAPVEKVDRREGLPERPVVVEETTEPKAVPDARELARIASEVQIRLKQLNTELRFEIEDNVEDLVIKIVDPETEEVIKQIPSKEMVEIRDRIDELVGFLLDEKT
jgi:flagellar protein FlaG